jgi:hypothetical protein
VTRAIALVSLIVVLFVALPVTAQAPDCAPTCEWRDKQEWVDADTESLYDAGACTILQVRIKAATRVLLFDADGCVDGYCVSGIGTGSGRAWEDAPRYDISHVGWCVSCPPTAVTLVDARAEGGSTWALWLGFALVAFALGAAVGYIARDDEEVKR